MWQSSFRAQAAASNITSRLQAPGAHDARCCAFTFHKVMLLLWLLFVAGGQAARGDESANPLPCTCSDVDARVEYDSVVEYRCWEHFTFGQCDMPFMKNTVKELTEGYCQITCGRCSCCPSLAQVAKDKGLSKFVDVAKAAGLSELEAPGWEVALFAPDNAAMDAGLSRLGYTMEQLKTDKDAQQLVREVLKFHAVTAVPHLNAVYTSKFLTDGQLLNTYMDNDTTLQVNIGSSGTYLKAPKATAKVNHFDVYACKGYLNIIDTMLLPWESNHYYKVGTRDLSLDCHPHGNAAYEGQVLKVGSANKKGSAKDCCYSCKSMAGCNIWVYCPRSGGCKTKMGGLDEPGSCYLKFQQSVQEGGYAISEQEGILTSHVSGAIRA